MTKEAKQRVLSKLEAIYAVRLRTFDNTALLADWASAELSVTISLLAVVSMVSHDKAIRDAANTAVVSLETVMIVQFSLNRQLYEAMRDVQNTTAFQQRVEAADASGQHDDLVYWMRDQMDTFKRNGMELDGARFERVGLLQKQLSSLTVAFESAIREDATQIEVPVEDMRGTSAAVLQNLAKTDDGTSYVLQMDYPTVFGVLQHCEVAATRLAVETAFNNRAYPDNEPLLKAVIRKRHELAVLLGYVSYSHYELSSQMAKSPEVARKFVEDLVPKLQAKWRAEQAYMKVHLPPSVTLTPEGDIPSADIMFVMTQIMDKELHLDDTKISEYFPMDRTLQGLFQIYESFFDITFVRHINAAELWDPDVATLAVFSNKGQRELIGHIIIDLFPRNGKYSHACCHCVIPPILENREDALSGRAEAVYATALAVVIANFPKPVGEKPALFLPRDVETFFHEFGHAIHCLMGRATMPTFAGTSVKRDFVELPSQLLEQWLWEPEILQRITSHYKTGEPVSPELIKAKVRSQNAFSGRDALRQLQFATYALSIFGLPFSAQTEEAKLTTTPLLLDIYPRVMPGIAYSDKTHFECSFGHLMGYGASYYGYMWSEVLAQDVFSYICAHNGLLDPVMGRRYVDYIIGVGGNRDPNAMLRAFLEREPNSEAFIKKLGV